MSISLLSPTLNTCEALARIGFPQDTACVWMPSPSAAHRLSVTFRAGGEGGVSGHVAAPMLEELLAYLPQQVDFPVPHPILGTVARSHHFQMTMGPRVAVGYHLVGTHRLKHRTEHERPVEAVARLLIALHGAGLLPATLHPMTAADTTVSETTEAHARLARAA